MNSSRSRRCSRTRGIAAQKSLVELIAQLRVGAAGISAERVRPPGAADLVPGEDVMEMATTQGSILMPKGVVMELSRTLQTRRSELDRYLIELMEQSAWVEGIRYLLADRRASRRPWPCYRGEHDVWT
jgi:hypothetical protein